MLRNPYAILFWVFFQVSEDRITPFFLDLEDHVAIPEACESMLKVYGRVDVLINNAGMGARSVVRKTELDIYKKIMDLNFFGQIAITKGNHNHRFLLCRNNEQNRIHPVACRLNATIANLQLN